MTEQLGEEDRRIIDRGARQVAWTLILTATALVIVGVIGFVLAVTVGSRHESEERLRRGECSDDFTWVIDRDKVFVLIIVFGVVAIAAAGLAGWWAARRAVRPLAEALVRQRRFVADASHELRTPLTVLSTRAQVLGHRLDAGQPVHETLDALDQDAAALASTLDDLLLTTAQPAASVPPVDVAEAVRTASEALRVVAQSHSVELEIDASPAGRVRMPRTSLERCVTALVDNAVRHSPAGATVRVVVHVDGGQILVDVSDEGAGITGIDPARIFDRFAHADEGARHDRRGFGIGLALVRELLTQAGGWVEVLHSGEHGTVMRMRLRPVGAAEA